MAWCDTCDRYFPTRFSFTQHLCSLSPHNWCEDCDVDLDSRVGLQEHWVQSPNTTTANDATNTLTITRIGSTTMTNSTPAVSHATSSSQTTLACTNIAVNLPFIHSPTASYAGSFSKANLTYMNSSIHRPPQHRLPRHICNAAFISQSAPILHLEAGTCRSGINRAIFNKVVQERDTNNIIADPLRLLTGPGGSEVTYTATGAAWDGSAYECYLCHNQFHGLYLPS